MLLRLFALAFSCHYGDRASRPAGFTAGRHAGAQTEPIRRGRAGQRLARSAPEQSRPFENPGRAALGGIGFLRSGHARTEGPAKSVFRIRLTRPNDDCQLLLFRLYFDDKPEHSRN